MKSYKNQQLINILGNAVDSMCDGLGTRKVKLFLNSRIKAGDSLAFLLRSLLECETLNVNAKKYNNTMRFSYRESYYNRKHSAVNGLLRSLIKDNPTGVVFSREESDVDDTSYIVYFEHPSFGQVSFHSDLDEDLVQYVPKFTGKWDGMVNSTIRKLENAIWSNYGSVMREKYKDDYEKIRLRREEEERIIQELEALRKWREKRTAVIVDSVKADVRNILEVEESDEDVVSLVRNRLSKKQDDIVRLFMGEVGFDCEIYPAFEELRSKMKERGIDGLIVYIDESSYNSRRGQMIKDKLISESKVIHLLREDLNNVFEIGDFTADEHSFAYKNLTDKERLDIAVLILERYNQKNYRENIKMDSKTYLMRYLNSDYVGRARKVIKDKRKPKRGQSFS